MKLFLRLGVVVLLLFFLLVFLGTLYQADVGVYRGIEIFFEPWIVSQWAIPLPGGRLLILLTFLLTSVSLVQMVLKKFQLGLILTHLGLLLLLAAAIVGLGGNRDYILAIGEGQEEDRMYFEDAWDIVAYQLFEGVEIARSPLEGSQVLLDLEGREVRLDISEIYRNSERGENDELISLPAADERAGNMPGVRVLGVEGDENEGLRLTNPENMSLHGLDTRPQDLAFVQDLGAVGIILEPRFETLPFRIRLQEFSALRHPGTEEIARYESRVIIEPEGLPRTISMNSPLEYQGFRLFQNSYRLAAPELGLSATISIFRVRQSRLSWVPYLGTFLAFFGMILHGVQKRLGVAALVIVFALIGPLTLEAQTPEEIRPASREFAQILVQAGGRYMSLEVYADLAGEALGWPRVDRGLSYLDRLVLTLLSPGDSDGLGLFPVDNPTIFPALLLEYDQAALYSYNDLGQGFLILDSVGEAIDQLVATPNRPSDPLEEELIRLYQRGKAYRAWRGALNPPSLGAAGTDPLTWVGSPLALVPLQNLLDPAAGAEALHPIPAALSASSPLWKIPGDPALVQELGELVTRGVDPLNPAEWPAYGRELRQLQEAYLDTLDDPLLQNYALRRGAEQMLHRGNLWFWAGQGGFVLGMVWLLIRLVPRTRNRALVALRWGSIGAAATALVTLGLMIFVTRRPPVTNLGASLDFVGTIALVFGAIVSWRVGANAAESTAGPIPVADATTTGPVPAAGPASTPVRSLFQPIAFFGAWILITLGSYLGEGADPLGVLPAVLDTNLWLTVHVLTVVSGYSVVVLAGVLGNILVLRSLLKPGSGYESGQLDLTLRWVLVIGLALTFFGTMLGGFWADQAWGRFWGWDPKENGALLIILWTAVLLHLGPAKITGDFGIALGSGVGLLVVGFSWFGVNLMGAGLHSYGFNARTLVPLVILGVLQVGVLVAGLVGSLVKKSSSNSKKAPSTP